MKMLKKIGHIIFYILVGLSFLVSGWVFYLILQSEIDSYKGGEVGKVGALAFMFIYLILFALIIVNGIFNFLTRNRSYPLKLLTFIPILLNVLTFSLPFIFMLLPSYEIYAREDIAELSKTEEFRNLIQIMEQAPQLEYYSILTEKEHVVVNDIVINTKFHSYGNVPEFGFFKTYYDNSLTTNFTIISEPLQKAKSGLNDEEFQKIYNAMDKLEITDFQRSEVNSNSIMIMWGNSAGYGARGVLVSDLDHYEEILTKELNIVDENIKELESGRIWYFRREPDPFM